MQCQPVYQERASASRQSKGEKAVWHRRFWEHVIRDENDYERHVEYIHYNPVKHGEVKAPKEHTISLSLISTENSNLFPDSYLLLIIQP